MASMNKLQLRVNQPEAEIIRDALLTLTGDAAAPVKLDEVRRLGLWLTWRIAQYWPAQDGKLAGEPSPSAQLAGATTTAHAARGNP
jgi:hypothetical protein